MPLVCPTCRRYDWDQDTPRYGGRKTPGSNKKERLT